MNRRLLALGALCTLVSGMVLAGCASSEPGTPAATTPVQSGPTVRMVDSQMGLRLQLPSGWAVRADGPPVLAVWPDPFLPGSTVVPQSQPDGVIVIAYDYYLETSDEFSGPDAFESAWLRMKAKGYVPGATETVTFHGEQAKAVRGTSDHGTNYVIVSPSYVVEATTEDGASASGLTEANVDVVLQSLGYVPNATP